MSIISIVHDKDRNLSWLGSNSRATIGSFVAPSVDRKWFALKGWAIGITGSGPKIEALQARESEFPDDVEHPHQVLQFLKKTYEAFDIGETDEGLKRYCGSGLLAHQSGRAWDYDNSFCLMEIPIGTYWARGSGMDVAIGAAKALAPYGLGSDALSERCLEVTIDIDVDCPGEPILQTFDDNGVLSEPKSGRGA